MVTTTETISHPSANRQITTSRSCSREAARHAQALHDPLRLPVERHGTAGPRIEDHDADRRGLDQDLEVCPRPLLVTVQARVDDHRGRLPGEQQQDFLVFAGEVPAPTNREHPRRSPHRASLA